MEEVQMKRLRERERMTKRKRLDSSKREGGGEEEVEEETPLRPVFCLKNKNRMDLNRFDEMEDCYFLDFDPFDDSLNLSHLSFPDHSDLSLVAEKGQVACRDYPHPRYLCLKFPFHKTPHDKHCKMCFCYVCDAIAPCDHWTPHCHASHTNCFWKRERQSNRNHTPPPLLH